MNSETENAKLRDLLRRMREEADEAWRNVDPQRAVRHHAHRDLKLRDEVVTLIGPAEWDALAPATHITWGDQAICHWTFYPPAQWPPTQHHVKINELIVELPCKDDVTYLEFVAHPDTNWNGVDCDACRVRLPTLLRELAIISDDLHEGIMEGFRTHPATLRAQELYARDVAPTLTADQRQRHEAQAQRVHDQTVRRSARRQRQANSGRGTP